ncbi:MAG: CPBP family intramembrane metalloprotease [Lachnospiraceae bacterium]|nr:CPBP family intramembrane metalloprotease [Lachnospiraceae bacterium]MBD5498265.1 CPBP family intramembrane metalloprotease [Lachnospiraceae bacterium]MBD5512461.1 CPBP family intramembrane metalloprotease [Lachnospiraceae bacterium]
MLVNKIISSIVEIVLIGLVPFIWWLVTARKKEKFLKWIGIKGIEKENQKAAWISTLVISLLFIPVSVYTLYIIKDIETATSEFKGLGISALLPALIYAIFNTSLPEEIFFRGFLLKRLSNKAGYRIANILQSMMFGLLHGIMFFSLVGIVKAVMVIVLTGAIAFAMGYVNEKKANGSILPSWFIHALSNIFASVIAMFSLI